MRNTSIEAYIKIKENGLLSKRRLQVYEFMFEHGPCTGRSMHKALSKQGTNSSTFISRISELVDLDVMAEVGQVFDEETNNTVKLWDVTPNLPIKRTAIEKKARQIEALKRKLAKTELEYITLLQKASGNAE
jgi:hypothetical protein